MSESKWLHGLRPDMPIVAAARHGLLARISPVRDHLSMAVKKADEDPEYVHQLRVSTRRAGAAVRIFATCLPGKVFKEIRRKLRNVRRAAGAARDWDVFLDTLSKRRRRVAAVQQRGIDWLLGFGNGQRQAAQDVLIQATKNPPLDLDKILTKTVSALRLPPGAPPTFSLRDLAIPLLNEHLALLNKAAEENLKDYKNLHQVRIKGKRLRYAMEIFACSFESSFQDNYYPAIEEMQEILGQANDSHVASERLEAIRSRTETDHPGQWERYQPGIEALLRYHQRNLPQKRKLFMTWWRDWQQSGAEEAFSRLLKCHSH